MSATLMHTETNTVVEEGAMLRHKDGGKAWRYEKITEKGGEHHVIASQVLPHMGRATKTFHPHVFGCHVDITMAYWRSSAMWHDFKSQTFILFYGGLLALIPLAFFEHFHIAARIFGSGD